MTAEPRRFDIIRLHGFPFVYRCVGCYMVGTEVLEEMIECEFDEVAGAVDNCFAGYVPEHMLYHGSDEEILELLDIKEE